MLPTRPGQRCKVVMTRGVFNKEGASPNMNKEVVTMWLHPVMAGGVTPVWHVSGQDLITYYGAIGNEADFLIDWLEVIPDDKEPDQSVEHQNEMEGAI